MLIDFTSDGLIKYYNSQIIELEAENKKEYKNRVANENQVAYVEIYDKYLNNIPQSEEINKKINDLEGKLGAIPGHLDYGHQIKEISDKEIQRECWIIRLQIFIRILLDTTIDVNKHENNINLQDYKLGIFGSNKPTSDIDVGVQYTELDKSNLSKLVKIIEDKFVFLGYRTLDFDIELYGDLLTITKLIINLPVEYLYLSNSNFNCQEFLELLSYCGASIYRNYLHKIRIAHGMNIKKSAAAFEESFLKYCEVYIDKLTQLPEYNKFDDTTKNLLFSLLRTCVTNSRFTRLFKDVEAYIYSEENIKVDNLQKFNEQRAEYYRRIDLIEQSINNRQDLLSGNAIKLSNKKILELISAIGNALIYRDESYVCVPTIIHVVRIIQARSENAIHKMGNYGYLISILEQIGYLFRFDGNETKFEKYNQRLIDALLKIKISENLEKCIAILPSDNRNLSQKHTIRRNLSKNDILPRSVGQRRGTLLRVMRGEKPHKINIKRRRVTKNRRPAISRKRSSISSKRRSINQ